MASGNEMESARETYSGFTHIVKWGSIACAVVVAFVVFLIA